MPGCLKPAGPPQAGIFTQNLQGRPRKILDLGWAPRCPYLDKINGLDYAFIRGSWGFTLVNGEGFLELRPENTNWASINPHGRRDS